jgi:RimJ/RimL family protein N-acetyltransferase
MQLAASGARRYFLTVHGKNERSIVFYAKQEFVHEAARDRDDEWYMVKVLAQPDDRSSD